MAGTEAGREKARRILYMLLHVHDSQSKTSEPIPEPTLQNEMFILTGRNPAFGLEFNLETGGGRSRCHSGDLADTINEGIRSECIVATRVAGCTGYELGGKGRKMAREWWDEATLFDKVSVSSARGFTDDMTEEEAVAYFASTSRNIIKPERREEYEGYRRDQACSLFKRGKISTRRGAEIAGLPLHAFVTVLRERGIDPYKSVKEDSRQAVNMIDTSN
ncbi:MAG: UPF0175 family protein [Nitrosopumilus sp.]|nr:UPF0175 family protein [Nitrosopumilus sp.]MDA7943682.1 UPF0175 family protein [Nitrosopumilus sp.]MDA7999493.1 UPF0175 family protein [Nitrosopumilus sp.]